MTGYDKSEIVTLENLESYNICSDSSIVWLIAISFSLDQLIIAALHELC